MLIELGISARHVHLNREAIDLLFGEGYELTNFKDLKQLGQFAANEKVEVHGPKGSFGGVRILGPARRINQVEVSVTDCIKLGVLAVLRDSGDIADTPGVVLIGPKGQIELKEGVIVAARHAHFSVETALKEGITDGDRLCARVQGNREVEFRNVLARVDASYVDELHLDTDEANGALAKDNQRIEITKCQK